MTELEVSGARRIVFPITPDDFHYPSVLKCTLGAAISSLNHRWSYEEKIDIASDATLRLHAKVKEGKNIHSLSYIYSTVNNIALDVLRRAQSTNRVYGKVAHSKGLHLDLTTNEMYRIVDDSVTDTYDIDEAVLPFIKWAFPEAWLMTHPESPNGKTLAESIGYGEKAFRSTLHRQRKWFRRLYTEGLTSDALMRHAVKNYEWNRKWWDNFPEYFPKEEYNFLKPLIREQELVKIAKRKRELRKRLPRSKKEAKVKVPGRKRGRPKKGDSQPVTSSEGNISREAS